MMRSFVTGVALVAIVGCKQPSLLDDNVTSEVTASESGAGSGSTLSKDEPKRSPITPSKLSPIISDLGVEGVTPNAIVVSFATPIIERDESGRVTSKTVLEIKPSVPGTLTYLGTSQLKFTPALARELEPLYARVKHVVTPMEWVQYAPLIKAIND